jgi:hypothetical protein
MASFLCLTEPSIGVRKDSKTTYSSSEFNTNLSPYFRFYYMHRSQGRVDWFRSIFVLGQGGLERAARNDDQPRVQHDVAAKNLALDRSNAAQSDHCSADR